MTSYLPDSLPQSLDRGLHEIFSATAERYGAHRALCWPDGHLTYRELEERSDAWAAWLSAEGLRPGQFAAVALDRSADLVLSVLSILKCGAAYCLLDPRWPRARQREMVRLLRPACFVTDRDFAADVPVRRPPKDGELPPAGTRPVSVRGSAPACVFSTSGTTGKPKAVVSPHAATARLFAGPAFMRLGPGLTIPLAAPAPWDAFSLELWSALLTGGTAVLTDEPYLSPHGLRRVIADFGVTTAWLTAGLFNMIVDEDLDAMGGLEELLIGGERLSPDHVRRFLQHHPGTRLVNGYGPVESTVFATTHEITPEDCRNETGIPLGRAVPWTRVHVMDGDRPCEPGRPGEICVEGAGLAVEYLRDPAETAGRFVRIDLGDGPRRLYRTGDLGYQDAAGVLHYRGRADRQAKIRGVRVEPAEIEQAVLRHLPVRACRVLPRLSGHGTVDGIVAFCVPVTPGDPLPAAVATLRSLLLPQQVPDAVVSVEAFPLTPQGKLDEEALLRAHSSTAGGPGQDGASTAADGGGRGSPVDDLDGVVAATFRAVLGREVPAGGSFFQYGGTSLAAGRVCARLTARLSVPVPVGTLYANPSVSRLAARLRELGETPASAAPTADAAPDPVPLTPMQRVLLLHDLRNPGNLTNHCLLVWSVEGELDHAALQQAVRCLHRAHPALRRVYAFDPRGDGGGYGDDGEYSTPPPEITVLPAAGGTADALARLREELTAPLAPMSGRVWRVAVAPWSPRCRLIGLVVHHVAFDGWSESLLAADLGRFYSDFDSDAVTGDDEGSATARAVTPPPRPSHGAAPPAAGQLASQTAAHLAALRRELAGVPPLAWPAAPAAPAAGDAPVTLTADATPAAFGAVRRLGSELGVSAFSVLLAQWACALGTVVGQDDFAVGVPVAQRDTVDRERTVGCFMTMMCIRFRGPDATAGTRDAIAWTGERVRAAMARQAVPVTELLALDPQPPDGRPPLFQTLFAYQDNAPPDLRMAGARTRFMRQPYPDLPLELHTELWPTRDGGLRVALSYRPDAVAPATARACLDRYASRLARLEHGTDGEEGRVGRRCVTGIP